MGYRLKNEETITDSKSTIKTIKICLKGVKYVQNQQEKHPNDVNDVFWFIYC